jgi:hypothetical protein
MSLVDTLSRHSDDTTSRRTVVKTGAKLAYAAPLIAATMGLSAQHSGAVSIEPTEVCSPAMVFSGNGWGGWSCPDGMHAVGANLKPAGVTVQYQAIAGPGYVTEWGYVYGPKESGYVVQNDNDGESITICVLCAPGYPA